MSPDIDSSLLNHLGMLEISVADIVENNKHDLNYIQQTLYFLRYVTVRLHLQRAGDELLTAAKQSYSELFEYNNAIVQQIQRSHKDIPLSIEISDPVTLKQMKELGFQQINKNDVIQLTKEDDERLKLLQERAKQRRNQQQTQRKHVPEAITTENSVLLTLLERLGLQAKGR